MVRRTAKRKGIAGLLLGGAAVMALAVVGYAPSLNGEFLWDDHDNVAANPMLHDLEGLYETWASPFANIQYYPITHTSFWLEHRIWGSWPAGYRITNLLLHGVVAVLIGLVLVRLEVPGAGFAAAIFALHPVHVETVAWITERKNILSALFYLAAMLAYLRFAGLGGRDGECSGRRRWSYLLALVLFAAALLSKTAVLTLPLALWIILWWKKGRLDRADLLATGPMLAMAVGLGLVTVWLESNHLGASGPEWHLGVLERVLVAGRAFWFYLSKLAMPVGLNFIYPRWPIDAAAIWQYLFPAALLASFWTLWIFRNRIGKAPLAGALFFAVTLAPSLGLLGFYFQIYSFVQDHHQYLASAGLIGLWTALATVGLTRFDRRFGGGIAVLLLLALTGATWQRSAAFASEESLWKSVIARNPGAWMAQLNLGYVYSKAGDPERAMERFRAALEVDPERHRGHLNFAVRLEDLGRLAEAEQHCRIALAKKPDYVDAHSTLGRLLATQGRYQEAVDSYARALELDSTGASVHYNLGVSLEKLGRLGDAEAAYRNAILADSRLAEPHNNLAIVLFQSGRHDEAGRELRRFQELGGTPHPGFLRALSEVGVEVVGLQ